MGGKGKKQDGDAERPEAADIAVKDAAGPSVQDAPVSPDGTGPAPDKAKKAKKAEKNKKAKKGHKGKDKRKAEDLAASGGESAEPPSEPGKGDDDPDHDSQSPAKGGKAKAKRAKRDRLKKTPTDALAMIQAAARDVRTALAAELSAHGLYAGQERILLAIETAPGTMLADIANALGVKAPTVTKAVTRLEAQGFVGRAPSEADARAVLVTLTERGESVRDALVASIAAVEERAFAGMKKGEIKDLAGLLGRIVENVRA